MSKKRKISIKDISKALGISTTTISFIINNKAENRISKEVIKKVQDYIAEVGYIPNSSARTLRTGRSKTIVFMAEDISDPFFSAIAKEMEEIAFRNGYKIIYCSTENKRERALELLKIFKDRQVDAFIITPPENFREDIEILLKEKNQVLMLFDRCYEELDHNYVVLDNLESSRNATTYLIGQGYKNIGFVGLESDISPTSLRLQGYKESLQLQGKKEASVLIPYDHIKSSKGQEMIQNFLKNNPEIDSLLFATNSLAISGLKVLRRNNIKIPEDMGILTFDDRDLFELYSPTVSVISQPVSELANELIKGTLRLLDVKAKDSVKYQKVLEGQLIERESSVKRG